MLLREKEPTMDDTDSSLEKALYFALQHYSNVHRGTGHHSRISTMLYENARRSVRKHFSANRNMVIIFCSPWRLECLLSQLKPNAQFTIVSSRELDLPMGIRALLVHKKDLPKGTPLQPGGGTVTMVSHQTVSWADAPDRFEPGTPNIIGAIALAKWLSCAQMRGNRISSANPSVDCTPEQILYNDGLSGLMGVKLLEKLGKMVIGRHSSVPTSNGYSNYINLDHGASTPTFEPIWEVVRKTLRQSPATHQGIIRKVRGSAHRFFGAPEEAYDLFFASNTTEAIHIAAEGIRPMARETSKTIILNTMIEHNSNELIWRLLPGGQLLRLSVDNEGFIDLHELESLLRAYNHEGKFGASRIGLLCISGASNVMGSYQDLAAIGAIVHRYNVKLLVDGAQLAAHHYVSMAKETIDFLVFSAHKMYAPFGSGGLIARKGCLAFAPLRREAIFSSGNENVVGIAALGKAIDLLERVGMDVIHRKEQRLVRYALNRLNTIPGVRIYGIAHEYHKHIDRKGCVLCFEIKGVPHNFVAQRLAEIGGIGVRSGCFCVNMYVKNLLGIGKVKNALAHTGLTFLPIAAKPFLTGLVRASFGFTNNEYDIDKLAQSLENISARGVGLVNGALARARFGSPFLPKTTTENSIAAMVDNVVDSVYAPVTD